MKMKAKDQTSDAAQNGGRSGTKLTSVTPRDSSVKGQFAPAATNPSGSSQGMNRGKQG